MVPLLSLARREAGARAFTPTRAGLNRGVLQARASGVLRGRKVKRSLRNPHLGSGSARQPERLRVFRRILFHVAKNAKVHAAHSGYALSPWLVNYARERNQPRFILPLAAERRP